MNTAATKDYIHNSLMNACALIKDYFLKVLIPLPATTIPIKLSGLASEKEPMVLNTKPIICKACYCY